MGSGFKGTPEQFTIAHQRVSEVREMMDGELKTLRGNIEATAAGWQGEAAGAFQNVMMRFDEDAAKLNTALQGIADQLQAAGSTYAKAEVEQQQQIRGLSGLQG